MKSYLPALLMLVFLPVVSAQSDFKNEFHIGFNQGILLNRVVFNPTVNQHFVYGYAGGLMLRYISETQLGIEMEANYIQKGWKEKRSDSTTYERHMDMLEVPLLTHFYVGKQTRVRLQFILGPYVGYYLHTSERIIAINTSDYRDYYNIPLSHKMEIGYLGGISLGFRTLLGIFELQGSYRHSLMNLFKAGTPEFSYRGSRPQSIGLSVHYLVSL